MDVAKVEAVDVSKMETLMLWIALSPKQYEDLKMQKHDENSEKNGNMENSVLTMDIRFNPPIATSVAMNPQVWIYGRVKTGKCGFTPSYYLVAITGWV